MHEKLEKFFDTTGNGFFYNFCPGYMNVFNLSCIISQGSLHDFVRGTLPASASKFGQDLE